MGMARGDSERESMNAPASDLSSPGTYLFYDGACGTGGMLTVAEETLQPIAKDQGKKVATHLFGQEINSETYAIANADLLLKGEGEAADKDALLAVQFVVAASAAHQDEGRLNNCSS